MSGATDGGTGTVVLDEEARQRALDRLAIVDTEPEERFDRITRLAQQLFGVPMALVTLLDRDRQWYKSRQGIEATETRRADAFCDIAIRQPGMLVVEDATADERFAANPYVTGDPNVRFYAGQPLEAPGGERLGTLCIIDDRPRGLTDPERRLLRELATWVERELTINDEFDRAAEVQRGLLPRRAPVVPGYELAAACIPSRAVGGDFYDWYEVPGGLELTVADVMGKGLGAAIMTAGVRGVLRAAARTDGVAAALETAAATLEPDLEDTGTIVTLFHARLRAEDGLLRYADAGHGLTLVVRADGTAERATSLGLPLGALPGERWEEHALRLGPGDTLVTVSDGALDLYGGVLADLDELADRVRSAASATEVVDVVRARAEEAALLDDVTIVVIRRVAT